MQIIQKIAERIGDLRMLIQSRKSSLRELQSLDGHSCYGAGYDQGNIDAYRDELEFLTKLALGGGDKGEQEDEDNGERLSSREIIRLTSSD